MQKIVINDLGPINHLEMDIKQFNLLIGEQATGKSTISKAIYYFRMVKSELIDYLYDVAINGYGEHVFPKILNNRLKDIFVKLFGFSWNLSENLNLEYEFTDEISIGIKLKKSQKRKFINVVYSKKLQDDVKKLEKESYAFFENNKNTNLKYEFVSAERIRLHEEITKKMNFLCNDNMSSYYIPAGRSLLTLMTGQKTSIDYSAIDLVNHRFMQFIESIQPKFDMGILNVHKYYPMENRKFDVQKVSHEITSRLKSDYFYTQGAEYLVLDDKTRIPINFSSSGQQEVLWLLNQIYVLLLRNEKSFVIIEEPEAHLYPKLQKEVIDFIIQFANITGSQVLITTHSPYVLTCMNTAFYAGRLYRNTVLKSKVDIIVGKYNHVDLENFSAYKLSNFDKKTVMESLIDLDTKEMYTELIDEISDSINEAYTKLFYLEDEDENS